MQRPVTLSGLKDRVLHLIPGAFMLGSSVSAAT
jgi:hypothetical protein